MSNKLEFQKFFKFYHIKYETLKIETTGVINQYLNDYWKGSTSHIDWVNFQDKVKIVKLPLKLLLKRMIYSKIYIILWIFSVTWMEYFYFHIVKF